MKSFLTKLSLLLGALIFSLGLAEWVVRWIHPTPRSPYLVVADEKVGHLIQPDFVGRASNMFGDYDTTLRTNHEGFRDANHSLAKEPGTLRVAFLGDSFTFAEQVEEPACFVRRTETLLNERSKGAHRPRVEVMNFGIGGWDIPQYIQCYEAYIRKYRPDALVLMIYVDNDLLNCAMYLMDYGFGMPYFRLENGALVDVPANVKLLSANYKKYKARLEVHWYQHFQLYNLQKAIFWKIHEQWVIAQMQKHNRDLPLEKLWSQPGYRNYRYYAQGIHDPVVETADALSRLLLQRLEKDTLQDGTRLFVAMLPAPENLDPAIWPQRLKSLPGLEKIPMDFDRPFKEARAYLPELDKRGDIFDTRPILLEARKKGPVYFDIDLHFNARGQEAVAQALVPWLEQRLFQR